jgi:hypothetical protein
MSEKKANLKDTRTKQMLKIFTDGIQEERTAPFIPDGVKNELMDVKGSALGNVMGDCEIGSDGFIEIMFVVQSGNGVKHVVKLKRLPDEKSMTYQVW